MRDLEDVKESLVTRLGRVKGETICEDREDESMEELAPVGIIETANGVPENTEGADSGAGTVGHDGHVMCPIEPFVDKDSKVADERQALDGVGGGGGRARADGKDSAANQVFSGSVRRERNELSFIRITLQTIPSQPSCNLLEALSSIEG